MIDPRDSRSLQSAAEDLLRRHVDAINRGADDEIREQLVIPRSAKPSLTEAPLTRYLSDMRALAPIEFVSARATSEPEPRETQLGPVVGIWVEFELRIRGRRLRDTVPVWWLPAARKMLFASRIRWRPSYFADD